MSSGSIATEPMAVARQASLALHRLSLGGRTFQRQPSTQSQRKRGTPKKKTNKLIKENQRETEGEEKLKCNVVGLNLTLTMI